jgi:Cell wall-active antibiotics response 4TMS YvqF
MPKTRILPATVLALLCLTSPALAAAPAYTSVNITLKQSMGELKLSPSDKASPVMGARNPVVKNGVAYIGASKTSGDWAMSLSPKLPISLILERTSGDANLDLRTLKLTALSIRQSMGDLDVMLPAGNLTFTLKQTSGNINIQLPANVGISVEAQTYTSGTVIIGGKTVAEGMSLTGTYQSANYESAPYKVKLTVDKSMGDLTVK